MGLDGSGSVYFAQFSLDVGKAEADKDEVGALEYGECTLENLTRSGDTEILSSFRNVQIENIEF